MKIRPRNWTKDEVLAALALYCQLPFGQMHARNPIIIDLAKVLGRTPSSIALKLVNLASLDPILKARGVVGMANASKIDREVWSEYRGKWNSIATALPETLVDKLEGPVPTKTFLEENLIGQLTEVRRTHLARRGQQFFRLSVLAAYENKCCISGIKVKSLLRASHIIPWSRSVEHRLNPMNGLCLNPLHDAAFDQGLLTIDLDRQVNLSSKLKNTMPAATFDQMFGRYDRQRIAGAEKFSPSDEFINYHNSNVFIR